MSEEGPLTHLDSDGHCRMVDVGGKEPTHRRAVAAGRVEMRSETLALVLEGSIPKGDVLAVARVAGIMAAKRTASIIPLCHPLPIDSIELDILPDTSSPAGLEIRAVVRVVARTGVEMEALTAVSGAALAVYDMCKAVDRGMRITNIRLLEKEGGRSGHYIRKEGEINEPTVE